MKAFLRGLKSNITPGAEQETQPKSTGQPLLEHEQKLRSIKRELRQKSRELSQIARELDVARRTADGRERVEYVKRIKNKKQEIFRLEYELRATKARTGGAPETGSLPDFVIIGAPKCGTTFLYHLLTKHPHVEPAAFKETHYFDRLFEKGTEWYRGCFLPTRWKDGRRTITGEATPRYLSHPRAAERMAEVIPRARLIALLRNPVDRTYSAYQFFRVRHGREKGTFEETIAAHLDRPPNESPLQKSIYVDHLLRWSTFFDREQMLVLKSEDFFEYPQEMLNRVLDFLDLPDWTPRASDLQNKRNKGSYEQPIDSAIRRRLEEFFEPHNRRLYELLGIDFGW